jgi:hypothetical protein
VDSKPTTRGKSGQDRLVARVGLFHERKARG